MTPWRDPVAIKRFLASEEMSYDPMHQPSLDMAWHFWQQPKYDRQRKAWLESFTKRSKT